ncbi:hypothetical protein [Acidithiobacillus marinus]|nr:hypothetical protein [Acidithiobacillus marinus]
MPALSVLGVIAPFLEPLKVKLNSLLNALKNGGVLFVAANDQVGRLAI